MSNKTEINLTCKDCLFFDDLIHPENNFTCRTSGMIHYNSPCKNFCINTHSLTLVNNQNPQFYDYIRSVPTDQLSELAALLVQEGFNRRQGWSIGDICYFCLGKTQVISSYVQVVFKGLAGNTGLALIEGSRDRRKLWTGLVELKHLVKGSEWAELHEKLVKENKISDESMHYVIPGYSYPKDEILSLKGYRPSNIVDILKYDKDYQER